MARSVVITGCSTGFGHRTALRLARSGDRVYATMRGVMALTEVASIRPAG